MASLVSSKRPPPPVTVPPASKPGGGMASKKVRDLQVMLVDLGIKTQISSVYSNDTRNSVSLLQQRLIENGSYTGAPHGAFDAATRDALLADDSIPTVTL